MSNAIRHEYSKSIDKKQENIDNLYGKMRSLGSRIVETTEENLSDDLKVIQEVVTKMKGGDWEAETFHRLLEEKRAKKVKHGYYASDRIRPEHLNDEENKKQAVWDKFLQDNDEGRYEKQANGQIRTAAHTQEVL